MTSNVDMSAERVKWNIVGVQANCRFLSSGLQIFFALNSIKKCNVVHFYNKIQYKKSIITKDQYAYVK